MWGTIHHIISFYEPLEVICLDEFLHFVFQGLAPFGSMAVIAMVLAMFGCVSVLRGLRLSQGQD